jgi:hypothetical protein
VKALASCELCARRHEPHRACDATVGTIVLEPDGDRLKITLKGDLPGFLSADRDSKRSPDTGDLLVQIRLVAGGVQPLIPQRTILDLTPAVATSPLSSSPQPPRQP